MGYFQRKFSDKAYTLDSALLRASGPGSSLTHPGQGSGKLVLQKSSPHAGLKNFNFAKSEFDIFYRIDLRTHQRQHRCRRRRRRRRREEPVATSFGIRLLAPDSLMIDF